MGFQPLLACRVPGCELAAHQSEIKVEDDERGQEEWWLVKHFSAPRPRLSSKSYQEGASGNVVRGITPLCLKPSAQGGAEGVAGCALMPVVCTMNAALDVLDTMP